MKQSSISSTSMNSLIEGVTNDAISAFEHHLKKAKKSQAMMLVESPIEELFFCGLIASSLSDFITLKFGIRPAPKIMAKIAKKHRRKLAFQVVPQFKIDNKRIDFVVYSYKHKTCEKGISKTISSCVAVECDGYDYHHGNPIAAARDKKRDRELSQHFDAIIRFTGSELNKDPFDCASSALLLAVEKMK